MKVLIPETGRIAESVQGRDKGRLYAILEDSGNGYVSVVDGVKRTLRSPKKKNVKHLRLLPVTLADGGIVRPWNGAFDVDVAHYLKVLRSARADGRKSEE